MKANLVYMTAGDANEARDIGKVLVSERLAACVNILDNMNSMFWWDDAVQMDKEVVLIAKTKESLVQELVDKVISIHSYDCPCVVILPISGGNPAFLEWISGETK